MIGSIPEFYANADDWNVYEERLEQFFEVNDIDDAKKGAFLISVIGANTYKILRDLCHPVIPKNKTYEELCALLRKQLSPQVAIFRERSNFYNAKQNQGETVTSWYGRLKSLAVNCKFGDTLESILLDKFITGLRSGTIMDRLCEENETLSLNQAVDIAINKESAIVEGMIPAAYNYNNNCNTNFNYNNNNERRGRNRRPFKPRRNDNEGSVDQNRDNLE